MSDIIKDQGMPEGVVSENAETPQDVVVSPSLHVIVLQADAQGYRRLAHWQMLETPSLLDDLSPKPAWARAILGKLLKHLRGGPEI